MPINLLRRHGFNSPSTPYSSARCNLEHVVYFEQTAYDTFLDSKSLLSLPSGRQDGQTYFYNKSYATRLKFSHGPNPLFEYSHINPLTASDTFKRRIERLSSYKTSSEPKIFLYHHRSRSGYDDQIMSFLFRGFKYLSSIYNNSSFLCITHSLVDSSLSLGFSLKLCKKNICFATISSSQAWGGEEKNFHALHDDQLLLATLNSASQLFL